LITYVSYSSMSVYNRTAASTFQLHLFWLCWFDLLRPFVSGFLQFFYSCHTWALGYSPMAQVSTDQRGRLMMTTERLNQSTDRIKESRRTMLETEELGVSILQDLHQQRQSLLHAHTTVCTCLSSTSYYIDLLSGRFLILLQWFLLTKPI